MTENRDGIRCIDRRAWGYSQTLRYNGRDTLTLKELVGCIRLDHKQDLHILELKSDSRDILEVNSSGINNDYRRDLHA